MTVANGLAFSGIIVDIILFFIIAGNAVLGYRRGLAGVIFNICSTIVAIVLVLIFYKPTTNYVMNHTKLAENTQNVFEEKLQYLFEKENVGNTEQLQKNDDITNLFNVFIGDEMGSIIQETTDSVTQYLSQQITYKIISVLVFFVLFAVIRLLLYVLKNYVELVANLPIIRVLNGSGGMIYGIIKGFLVIYGLFAILSLLLPIIGNNIIITAIQSALIGSKMFNHNIILNLIFKFL